MRWESEGQRDECSEGESQFDAVRTPSRGTDNARSRSLHFNHSACGDSTWWSHNRSSGGAKPIALWYFALPVEFGRVRNHYDEVIGQLSRM